MTPAPCLLRWSRVVPPGSKHSAPRPGGCRGQPRRRAGPGLASAGLPSAGLSAGETRPGRGQAPPRWFAHYVLAAGGTEVLPAGLRMTAARADDAGRPSGVLVGPSHRAPGPAILRSPHHTGRMLAGVRRRPVSLFVPGRA